MHIILIVDRLYKKTLTSHFTILIFFKSFTIYWKYDKFFYPYPNLSFIKLLKHMYTKKNEIIERNCFLFFIFKFFISLSKMLTFLSLAPSYSFAEKIMQMWSKSVSLISRAMVSLNLWFENCRKVRMQAHVLKISLLRIQIDTYIFLWMVHQRFFIWFSFHSFRPLLTFFFSLLS